MRIPTKKIIPVIAFIILSAHVASAQQILFRNYTVADGMCSNTVWAITQDALGYMWFGTKNGLNRFDGYQFKSFRYDKEIAASIGNNEIHTILNVDKTDCWIATERGVYILDIEKEAFRHFQPLGEEWTSDIIKSRDGCVWIATTRHGLYSYNRKTKELKHFVHATEGANGLSTNDVRKIVEDDDGNIWIGTYGKGIDVLDPHNLTFRHYKATGEPGSLSSNLIIDLYKGRDGSIWIGTRTGGLNRWDKTSDSFIQYKHHGPNSISDNIVRAIYQPAPGKLYIGTEKGFDILDIAENKFTHYGYVPNDPHSLSDNAVYSIFMDREGGTWIGTYFGGVNYFHGRHANFELYYPTGAPDALSGKAVSAMLEDDPEHLWIGTEDGGLNYFDTRTKTFRHYPFKPSQEDLSYHNIHTLIKDNDGNIWIGTFTGGVNVYNPRTGKVKIYKHRPSDPSSISDNMIYSIYQDRDGVIWVGTVGGLNIYDPQKDAFIRVREGMLGRSWIYDIYEDSSGILWFATYNRGLIGKNKNTGELYHYTNITKEHALSSQKVICIAGAHPDSLWLGTDGGGLNLVDTKHNTVTVFDSRSGIDCDIVYGILEDKNRHLWLSTNNGLFDFNPATGTSRHYTQWDHLQSSQYNYKSYLKTSDGKFYFGGIQGFNAFYPDSIHPIHTANTISFTNFQLFNKNVPLSTENSPLKKSIAYTTHLVLSHSQSMFSFEYAALNYIAPLKSRYAYKMEGYDDDWNYVDNQRKATYTNLPAGDYIFKVRATDNNGNWSKYEAAIHITILPPFYKTNVAYVIYGLIALLAIIFLRSFFMRQARKKNEIKLERLKNKKEQEFYKQKIDFFTSMAHEIRTPLSLIIAPLEKLISADDWKPNIRQQLETMDENSNRLLMLTNQLLDFRRMESDLYQIHPEKIEIVSLVQALFSRFSSISYQKEIKFSIHSRVSRLETLADPEALTKILSNLLINAFKFTRTKVEIRINGLTGNEQGQRFFSISVEDDGIGIPKEDIDQVFKKFYKVSSGEHHYSNLGGNGIGLALAKTLAEKHNGWLSVESEEGINTVFTVLIPYEEPVTNGYENNVPCESNGEDTGEDAANESRPTVLIVEDDSSLLDFIHSCLQEAGYRPLTAKNGSEAMERLHEHNVDLIISDVMMPEMDGMEFCRKMKSNVDFSHIPLILLTAKANLEIEIEGIEGGADAYITKPFKWKHILAVIKNLLESRGRLKEKFSQQPFADAGSLTTNRGDKKFMEKIIAFIEESLADPQLSVEELSRKMAMSRSSLHKKLKAVSGHVPNEFIRLIRLKHAARLLLEGEYNISQIGYMTGFNSPSYFSKCFCQQFKVTPGEFLEKNRQDCDNP